MLDTMGPPERRRARVVGAVVLAIVILGIGWATRSLTQRGCGGQDATAGVRALCGPAPLGPKAVARARRALRRSIRGSWWPGRAHFLVKLTDTMTAQLGRTAVPTGTGRAAELRRAAYFIVHQDPRSVESIVRKLRRAPRGARMARHLSTFLVEWRGCAHAKGLGTPATAREQRPPDGRLSRP